MQFLTTPWRMEYVLSTSRHEGCVLCDLLANDVADEQRFILQRGKESFLVLNIYPYTPGHLMAIPYRHVASVSELSCDELAELLDLCRTGEKILRRTYGCRSVHTGANLGRAAGAGVPGHLHFHIVAWPAAGLWERCADAAEPPETLAETYARLRNVLAEI